MNTSITKTSTLFLYKNHIWLLIGLTSVFFLAIVIANSKWIYALLLFTPFLIFFCLKKPITFLLGAYVFLLPFEGVLVVIGESKGPTLIKLIGLLLIIILLFKGAFENKLKRPDKVTIWWVLFIGYCILSIVWAINPDPILTRAATAFGLLMLYLLVASYDIQRIEYDLLKRFILVGGFFAAMLIIYSFQRSLQDLGVEVRASVTFGDRLSGINKQAFDLLIPLSISVASLLLVKNRTRKIIYLFVTFVILLGILLTGSRGGMLGAVCVLVYFIISIKRKLSFGLVLIIIGLLIIPFIPDLVLDRFANSVESHADSRIDIWYVGYFALGKYWLLGAGLDNFIYAYTEFIQYAPFFIGFDRAPHNIFVGFFVELGIIGLLLLVVAFVKHYYAIRAESDKSSMDMIMLRASFWGIIVSSMALDSLWFKSFWLLLMLIVIEKGLHRGTTISLFLPKLNTNHL
jgi:O-antigen ligase